MNNEQYAPYGMFDNSKPKICPLTNMEITDQEQWFFCMNRDCRNVNPDKKYYLEGHIYHCDLEKKEIENWIERRNKEALRYKKSVLSRNIAQSINIDEFYSFCESLDEEMIKSKQKYNRDMVLNLYHSLEEKCLMYFFEDDKVIEIAATENPFQFINARFTKLKDESLNFSVSCCAIPEYIAEAIAVNLCLKYKMGIKVASILRYDNPVYIKARDLGKYINDAYGWKWVTFQKARSRYLDLTEIPTYQNVIYIKQEIDDLIRKESNN